MAVVFITLVFGIVGGVCAFAIYLGYYRFLRHSLIADRSSIVLRLYRSCALVGGGWPVAADSAASIMSGIRSLLISEIGSAEALILPLLKSALAETDPFQLASHL